MMGAACRGDDDPQGGHMGMPLQAAPIIGVPLSAKAIYTEWQAATALVDELV